MLFRHRHPLDRRICGFLGLQGWRPVGKAVNKADRAPVPAELRQWCFFQTENRCWYCGDPLGWGDAAPVIDHQLPRSRGGESSKTNCVAACMTCNHDKSTSNLEQYRETMRVRLTRSLERIQKALRGTSWERRLEGVDFSNFRFFGERV